MSKKKDKQIKVMEVSKLEATLQKREHYNPYQVGTGAHKTDKKPSRARQKTFDRKEMSNQLE